MASTPHFFKTYIHQVAKIIEGAADADFSKVYAYAEKLSEELEAHGESESAKRVRAGLSRGKAQKLVLARHSPRAATEEFRMPLDSESKLPIADFEVVSADNTPPVHLTPGIQAVFDEFITFYEAADQLVSHGVPMNATLLLHGEPGCGKTHSARWLASRLKLPLVTARTDSMVSSYLGSTAKNIRLLFEYAMSRPCILFLDEFDALAKMRDDSRELGELKRVVISLLQNIDAFTKDHVLIAATNHPHLLDPAIWRRFHYQIKMTTPDEDARRQILNSTLGSHVEPELLTLLTAISAGIPGSQIKGAAETLLRRSIVKRHPAIDATSAVVDFLKLDGKSAPVDIANLPALVVAVKKAAPHVLTQAQMARVFGVSQSRISKLLNES